MIPLTVGLGLIKPDDIPVVWPEVRDLIVGVLDNAGGDYNERDILLSLLAEQMQLWRAADTVCVTRVVTYPRQRVCELMYLAGADRKQWMHLQPALEIWAKSQGCAELSVFGRVGWDRVLKPEGWKKISTVMRKEI